MAADECPGHAAITLPTGVVARARAEPSQARVVPVAPAIIPSRTSSSDIHPLNGSVGPDARRAVPSTCTTESSRTAGTTLTSIVSGCRRLLPLASSSVSTR